MNLHSYLNSSIVRKLIFYLILMSTIISIFTSGFQIFSEYQRDMKGIHKDINQIKETHLHNIVSRLWVLDLEELEMILKGLLSLPSISYVAVYDEKNILLAEGDNISEHFMSEQYPLIYRDGNNDILLGKLMVKASLDNVQQNIIERAVLIIVGNTIKSFLIVLLLLLIFYHLVAKHILKISHYIDSLNIDNLDGSFHFDRKLRAQKDELDMVRSSILKMQKQLFESTVSLKNREKEQFEILNSMLDAVITIDEKGVILTFNRAAESIFGYGLYEVIGHNVKLLMPDEFAQKHDEYLHDYNVDNTSKVIGLGRDVIGMHKNKAFIPLRLFVSKLPRDIQGRRRFIGTLVDLTDFRNKEEQLRRSQKMEVMGKLTGGIAHDFNNLLSIILGYSDLLKNYFANDTTAMDYVKEIKHAGNRGIEMTNKLLSFSSENTYNARELNINKLLSNQKDMLQKTIAIKIKFEMSLANDLWSVYISGSDFEDALINLCVNSMHALKLLENDAYLHIMTSNKTLNSEEAQRLNVEAGDYILVSVSDNGCGMDAQTKGLIFDPFYTTKGKQGSGLGLTQVFGFVKRSKGVVDVKSKLKNGTTFNLYFPRYIGKNSTPSKQLSKETHRALGGSENILVVDDESSLRDLAVDVLSAEGYIVFSASNGKQAMEILVRQDIDLIVSDVIMPEMNGFQLASLVTKTYPHIKLLLVSGYNDKQHLKNTNEKYTKNILRKPYKVGVLLLRIRGLLDNRLKVSTDIVIVSNNNLIQPITWKDDFSADIDEIDEDHKAFLRLINQCIDIVNDNNVSLLGSLLQELLKHSIQHFESEEKILAINNYSLLERHKKVHQLFIDYINNYVNDFNQQRLKAQVLLDFLVGWFNEHIMGMDKLSINYFLGENDATH